jgi:hypothetical protein
VVPGVAAKAADLTDGQVLPTQDAGESITVQKAQGITLVPSAPGAQPAKVIAADLPAGAAVIHVIDTVLLPANAVPPTAAEGAAPAEEVAAEAPAEDEAAADSTATAGRKMKM